MGLKHILLVFLVAVAGCSDGALNDDYDRYLSRFGLSLTSPGQHKGAILGKALLADGKAASWAKVYARGPGTRETQVSAASEPFTMTTNDKGGFYLGDLTPGAYRLFVVSPGGQGVTMDVDVAPGKVSEFDSIRLGNLRRISGHAKLQTEDVHTGIVVYVPGSPFSSFTDNEGYYALDVPAGTYELRAERDTFAPYDSGAVSVAEDKTLDILLKPNPWPNGRVSVVAPHPFIVRGLETRMKIEPVSGVRYMRIREVVNEGNAGIAKLGSWINVKQELVLTAKNDGLTMLMFEFMDAYGKTSEPIYVQYYNTSLDTSWSVVYGDVDTPVVIKRGEKVAFIDSSSSGLSMSDETTAMQDGTTEEPVVPSNGDVIGSGGADEAGGVYSFPDSPGFYMSTNFLRDVTIEKGAKIRGGARFHGRLTVNGTAAEPVVWDELVEEGGGASLDIRGRAKISHAKMTNTAIMRADSGTELIVQDSELVGFFYIQSFNAWIPTGRSSTTVFARNKFETGYFLVDCGKDQLAGSGTGDADDSGEREPGEIDHVRLSVVESQVNRVLTQVTCANVANALAIDLTLQRNDYLETLFEGFYFGGDLPDQAAVNYTVSENHFRHADRLHDKVADQGWPAWFGENRAAPWNHFDD